LAPTGERQVHTLPYLNIDVSQGVGSRHCQPTAQRNGPAETRSRVDPKNGAVGALALSVSRAQSLRLTNRQPRRDAKGQRSHGRGTISLSLRGPFISCVVNDASTKPVLALRQQFVVEIRGEALRVDLGRERTPSVLAIAFGLDVSTSDSRCRVASRHTDLCRVAIVHGRNDRSGGVVIEAQPAHMHGSLSIRVAGRVFEPDD
jgi:hypothetical protein